MLRENLLPIVRVRDLAAREVEGIDLLLARAEVELHVAAEILALGAVLVDRDDRVLQSLRPLEGFLDVEIVVELQLALLRVACRDGLVELQNLCERREALLPVEDQLLRVRAGRKVDAFDWSHLEPRLPARLEKHHGADRKRPRDADQQRLNVLVVPDPPALEVRQLELALHDLR